MVAWPVVRQSERHELGLRQLASLIEQRLNRAWGPHTERRATVRLEWASLEGILGIEVRPTAPGELANTEERVFAIMDQLRSAPVGAAELDSLLADANSRPSLSGDLDLDQALYMAQKALFSWNLHVMLSSAVTAPTAAELQRWVREDLARLNVTEFFSEASAPPQQAGARRQSQPPKRLTYTVKTGESLQMIAHKFRVSILELIRLNRLHHPDQIAPGTRLTIPISPRVTPAN
jgi:LysM repeat protein